MGDYFSGWLETTRHLEKQKMQNKGEAPAVFKGFGQSGSEDGEAWVQWMDYVLAINEGHEADEDEEE